MSIPTTHSLVTLLARLSENERENIIRSRTPAQIEQLHWDWRVKARPGQLPPGSPGALSDREDWVHWVPLAGRGWGKTKVGAQTTKLWAENPREIIHLIGPTSASVRSVMIEGESGLMSCYPPYRRPDYEPSRHKITFPSGAVGETFSADEPERLRGPQCLDGESLVLMADGSQKRIDAVLTGDEVATRRGGRRVVHSWMTSASASVFRLQLSDGRDIICTGDHLVCAMPVSPGTERPGTKNPAEAITRPGSCFTGKYGKPNAVLSLKDFTFTTVTEIFTTIKSRTLNCFRPPITTVCTAAKNSIRIRTRLSRQPMKQRERIERSAFARVDSRALSVVANTGAAREARRPIVPSSAWTDSGRAPSRATRDRANSAARCLKLRSEYSDIAPSDAIRERLGIERHNSSSVRWFVIVAEPDSQAAGVTPDSAGAVAPSLSTREIVSVERLQIVRPVYDLTIEGEHEFFANGVLVHNCTKYWADEPCAWRFLDDAWDNLMFGFRLGEDPRGICTTTPKPLKWLMHLIASPDTVVTRHSSYENRSNLTPAFFRSIVQKYEGTRIGRQELEAEILTDVQGALWTRTLIDATRGKVADVQPEGIIRIVVAIDPAVSHNEDSDETGIIVAALTRGWHVLILDDLSCRESPLGWAKIAIAAYRSRRADRIVAEVNNGGDLVAGNIRAVDPSASVRSVRASRGKYIRAEPVAALYEQGRVHHIGTFPELEGQMTGWTPQSNEKSPDRMDALVWAVTELLIDIDDAPMGMSPVGEFQISSI